MIWIFMVLTFLSGFLFDCTPGRAAAEVCSFSPQISGLRHFAGGVFLGGNSGAIPGAENARRRAWFCAENCGIWPLVSVREGQKRVVPGRPGRMQMLKIHEQNVDEKERKIRRK